ncbi:MAG: M20 family metallopeptidase [Phycisphaerae bacterium]
MPDFASAIDELRADLVALRHDLHAHPELAYDEHRTAERVLREIQGLKNLHIRHGLAGTGIVATINPDRPGPCVALRADMDALPLQEENPYLPYASTCPGKMHACGHDGHTTCLVGAVKVLSRFAEELPGTVKCIFQPAEESGAGGQKLVEDEGVLSDPTVDAAFALHGWPQADVGQVIVGTGPVLAAAAEFDVTLRGTGAHAAYPHTGNDLVVAAAQMVTALQTVSSRWDPVDPVVVSICHLAAGHTYNVLPDTCRLKGTVRALNQDSHAKVLDRVRQVMTHVAGAFECQAQLEVHPGYPALENDATCADLVARVATDLLGTDAVTTDPPSGMGGEDFAFFARQVPAAWYRIGVCPTDQPSYPALHSPQFDFADQAIEVGVQMHCRIAQRFLTETASSPS